MMMVSNIVCNNGYNTLEKVSIVQRCLCMLCVCRPKAGCSQQSAKVDMRLIVRINVDASVK